MNTEPKTLNQLVAGDAVIINRRYDQRVRIVERVTAHYIIVAGEKYRRRDGWKPGDQPAYARNYITTGTPEEIADIRTQELRNAQLSIVRSINWDALSTDVLTAILKLVNPEH